MEPSLKVGAKGVCVERLQDALGITSDGDYGKKTASAVMSVQKKHSMHVNGEADRRVHDRIGLEWPSQYYRCLSITGGMEGTGFGGVNTTDIDGAGVTFGVIGFTSSNGEVQSILREYLIRGWEKLGVFSKSRAARLRDILGGDSHTDFVLFFYGKDGIMDADAKEFFSVIGKDPHMRDIQIRRARDSYWKPAVSVAQSLELTTMAGLGLMFDVAVQNGGFGQRHMKEYNKASQDGTEKSRMRAIANAVSAAANPQWRNDVYKRKMVFADGAGLVHGEYFALDSYGFDE